MLFVETCWAEDIRDIQPPVDFPPDYTWLLGLLGLLIVIAGLWFARCRRRRKPEQETAARPPAWETALERLEALKRLDLPGAGQIKEFYSRLSDTIRRYIEERFRIKAPEMTTEEFLSFLTSSQELSEAQKELLKNFLNSCDMVKFAKYGPASAEIERSFESARTFVVETKNLSV